MTRRGSLVVLAVAFVAACKSEAKPTPAASSASASPSASSASSWSPIAELAEPSSTERCSDPGLVDNALLERIHRDPKGAIEAIKAKGSDTDACLRLLWELARFVDAKSKQSFPAWAKEHNLDGKKPPVERASFALARRTLDLGEHGEKRGAVNAASVFYSVWLIPRPKWGTLDAEQRKLAARLVSDDISDMHDTEPMVNATLERDPEAVEVFRAYMGSYLGSGIVERLRLMKEWPKPPSWIGAIARELPEHTTLGELENPADREVIVKAMVELGGVDRAAAKRALDDAHKRIKAAK